MSTHLTDLTKSLSALIDGFETETVMAALGAVTVKHIINSTRTETQAHDLAHRFAKTLRSSVADAAIRKGTQP